ncbi:MAG: glycosyltransferase family 2 protein, partial [Chitinophagaceae bacterium]
MFSVIIPTWNNLAYVRLCVNSLRKNSSLPCEIILHINDGSDGTLSWASEEGILHTHTPENAGICVAVNMAASLATGKYIVYMNDDMYCCPGWDAGLLEEINNLPDDNFMISSTMIEPVDTGNKAVIVADFGRTAETFEEQTLLSAISGFRKQDWSGSTWPPVVVSRKMWHVVGGFSLEFSPGMASDDDFA